jgi:class 3 adenylate cyclase
MGARWVFTADGLAVNMAARIAGGASPGEFLVGPLTASRICQRFVLEPAGARTFKNIAEPVEVHRVVDVLSDC